MTKSKLKVTKPTPAAAKALKALGYKGGTFMDKAAYNKVHPGGAQFDNDKGNVRRRLANKADAAMSQAMHDTPQVNNDPSSPRYKQEYIDLRNDRGQLIHQYKDGPPVVINKFKAAWTPRKVRKAR